MSSEFTILLPVFAYARGVNETIVSAISGSWLTAWGHFVQ